jgi:hypothetical protein
MRVTKVSFIALLLLFAGCKKVDSALVLTSDEGADFIATSLAASTNGLSTVSGDITLNAQTVFDSNTSSGCGVNKAITVSHTAPTGAACTYNYQLNYNYTVNCNANKVADNITGSSTDNGNFDSPRLSSTNGGTSTFRVAGLTPTSTTYVINGEYKRAGTFTSKIDSKSTSNITVDFVLTNLTLNKTTKQIISGTAIVTITGNTAANAGISFVGSVTFTGNNKATVALNGSIYTVDLITGIFTK